MDTQAPEKTTPVDGLPSPSQEATGSQARSGWAEGGDLEKMQAAPRPTGGLRSVREIGACTSDHGFAGKGKEGGEEGDPFVVRWEPNESDNPKNWGVAYRWWLTAVSGVLVVNSITASSCPTGIIPDMSQTFSFSQEVGVLTISIFVAGYCIGPILWGPLSEAYGRRPIFILSFLASTGFSTGCALSRNTASMLVFRFIAGCFASAPLTNCGALIADLWDADVRGRAMAVYALAPFAGAALGPIVSGFISISGTDWRWVYWVMTIFTGVCLLAIVVAIPETYMPTLLVRKARRLRQETGEERWYAPLERADHRWRARLYEIVCKPFVMLALEPMLLAVTIYLSFIYGLMYLLFEAYPYVFIDIYDFNIGEDGAAFLGQLIGATIGAFVNVTYLEYRYRRHAARSAPEPPSPEKRLEMSVVCGWTLFISLFWFAWTSRPSIHWVSPMLATVLLGFSVLGMFVSLFNYIVEVYLWAAASALAAATVCRSAAGAGFPAFADQMYQKLGVHWAGSLLGFIALLLACVRLSSSGSRNVC